MLWLHKKCFNGVRKVTDDLFFSEAFFESHKSNGNGRSY